MPGATRIISVLPQILVNMVDFSMNLQEAIDAPRVHYADGEIWMEPRVPARVQRELADRGYKIELKKSFDLWFGGAQAVMIDPGSGKIYGGADPRRDGSVVGY
jgi:gamma-glutamyltranspeptidase/glutathione hydrolase